MRAIRTLAIISIIGLTMGAKHSLKQKLAERSNTLAQVSNGADFGEDLKTEPSCTCNCPILDTRCNKILNPQNCTCTPHSLLTQPPILGGGNPFDQTSVTTVLSSNQEEIFKATPANSFTSSDESSCCSCENALHQAGVNATKVRKFGIHGDICVTESIQFVENGCAEEASRGSSKKNSIHVEQPADAGLGGGPGNCTNFTMTVCSPGNVIMD